MKKAVAIALAVCALACLVLTVVSLATPVWVKAKQVSDTSTGLWEICVPIVGCKSYGDLSLQPKDYIKGVRALTIIAAILYAFAFLVSILAAVKQTAGKGISPLFAIAALFLMIGMIVFTVKYDLPPGGEYGYSYALGWVGFALGIVFAVLSGLFAKMGDYTAI